MTPLETYIAIIFTIQSLFIIDAHFDSITENQIIVEIGQKNFNEMSNGLILDAINEFLMDEKLDKMVLNGSTSKNFSSYEMLNEESLFYSSNYYHKASFNFIVKEKKLSIISSCYKSDFEKCIKFNTFVRLILGDLKIIYDENTKTFKPQAVNIFNS